MPNFGQRMMTKANLQATFLDLPLLVRQVAPGRYVVRMQDKKDHEATLVAEIPTGVLIGLVAGIQLARLGSTDALHWRKE